MQEVGIPIAFVGGTSIGSLIAAEYALDWPVDQMREANREAFQAHPLRDDYKMPMVSLATSSKTLRLYETHASYDRARNPQAVVPTVSAS